MDKHQKSLHRATRTVKQLGGISLLLAPLLTGIGWGISYPSLAAFLDFNLSYQDTNGALTLTANSSQEAVFRYYLLPHYFIYASMPFYLAMGLSLMRITYKKLPWLAFLGASLCLVGSLYFIGVLGAYLSAPIGSVVLTNLLKLSYALCLLVFVGNVLLGIALYRTRTLAGPLAALFVTGNLLILVFPGIENWMTVGSLFMVVSLVPLAKKIVLKNL